MQFANPFVQAVDEEAWNGESYPMKHRYLEGEDLTEMFPHWDVDQPDGTRLKVPSPHEFRHTLGTVLNTLAGSGFVLLGLWKWMMSDENPEPGTWAHFTQVAPPWFSSLWQLNK